MLKLETRKLKLGLLGCVLVAASFTQAVEFLQKDQFTSSEAETLRDETWISAQNITISGQALDDLFALSGTLDLRGTFHGDVWGCGDQTIASGTFEDQTRLAGRTIQVSGTLNGSLMAAGTTVKIDPSATIAKNMLCLGEDVISEGTIGGNVRIIAQKATLGGKVSGNVSITAQDLVLLPGTVIDGNLDYAAPKELVLSPSVTLNGRLKRTPIPSTPVINPNLGGHFGSALAALLTGLIFSAVFPRYTAHSIQLLRASRGACMLTGFISLLMIPVGAFLLMFTLVGLPLSILLILFYIILLYLSKIVVGFWIGMMLLRRKEFIKKGRFGALALGLLILYALTAFTALSLTVNLLVSIFGLGALLLALFKKPVLIIKTEEITKHPNT